MHYEVQFIPRTVRSCLLRPYHFLAFGDVLAPLLLMTIWSDRLGAPYWKIAVPGSFAIAAFVLSASSSHIRSPYRLPVFVVAGLLLSVISVGLYADWIRRERIIEFNADVAIQHTFFRSIREAPREFQFFLHSAALKGCVPYAWSYRLMEFYQLPSDVAVNVLPQDWLECCSIQRTR